MFRARHLPFCLLLLAAPVAQAQVVLERVLDDTEIEHPMDLRHDADDRLYVAEQRGRIGVFERGGDGAFALAGLFLDIRDRVGEADGEGGLFSFAFHPNYAANGFVFVHYLASGPRRNVIARFSRSADAPLAADPDSELILLEIEQPIFNHNGGAISFGPDGYLYITIGDGGCCGDPFGNAQNRTTLLGSVLRIDVDNPADSLNYGIPADNPFVGNPDGWREEIWAYGFRSPWRMTHDDATGDLWLGDVGEDRYEDVSLIERGGNYGWPIMEAAHCFDPPEDCDMTGLTLPVWEYGRELGCSVTGGYVYRGNTLPSLVGQYVYGDYVSGRIWSLSVNETTGEVTNTELFDTDFFVSSFGVDSSGELYVLNYIGSEGGGEVYRFAPQPVAAEPTAAPDRAAALRLVGPNPFAGATALEVTVPEGGPVRVAVYDVLGREVAVLLDGTVGTAQRVTFRAEGLVPGSYVVRMETATGTATQRLTLVR